MITRSMVSGLLASVCAWQRTLRALFCVLVWAATFGYGAAAQADTFTACLWLKIRDNRTECRTSSDDGVRRPCIPGGNVVPAGIGVELWDKDGSDSDDDDFIGLWRWSSAERQCLTFEFECQNENTGYECLPDVYIKMRNEVGDNETDAIVRLRKEDNSAYPKISWRTTCLATNCNGTCDICPTAVHIAVTDPNTDHAIALMALDSAQRALPAFGDRFDWSGDSVITLEVPSDASGLCEEIQGNAATINRNLFCSSLARAVDGDTMPHEMGHVLEMRLIERDEIQDNCSLNGDGWTPASEENESCATAEGWASYVAGVAWSDPNVANVEASFMGFDLERATPQMSTCAPNKSRAIQVTKAFWDLDDVNNEAAVSPGNWADNTHQSSWWIAGGWALFEDGTDNREDYESGVHGVNFWDYAYNRGLSTSMRRACISHNCLEAQEESIPF